MEMHVCVLCLHSLPWIACEAGNRDNGLSFQLGEGLVTDGMWEASLPLCSVPGPQLRRGQHGEREDPSDFSGIWSLAQALRLRKMKGQEAGEAHSQSKGSRKAEGLTQQWPSCCVIWWVLFCAPICPQKKFRVFLV